MTLTAKPPGSGVASLDAARPERAVIDLMHPDGLARRAGWIGGHGDGQSPASDPAGFAEDGSYDGLLIEAESGESGTTDWFESVLAHIDRRLTADGVAYLVPPRRARWRLLRDLPQRRFRIGATYLHIPYGESTYYLVDCETASMNLLSTSLPMSASRDWIVRSGLRLPGTTAWLPFTAKRVGIAVQRTHARPLFAWAAGWAEGPPPRARLARIKARAGSRNAIVWLFGERDSLPCAVVKRALTASAADRIGAELDALDSLGPAASAAGVVVPKVTRLSSPVVSARYEYISAVPADAVLAAQPARLRDLVHQLARWLEDWNSRTRKTQQIDTTWLRRELFEPAHAVQGVLERPESYFRWLSDACARISGRTLALVASHGDLTMSNVLVSDSGSLAIVDWESARPAGLPLSDLYYAAADALAAVGRYQNRAGALAETFASQSEYGRFVADLAASIDRGLATDPESTEVLLHATALQHAADERQKGRDGLQPFASLVRSLETRVRERV